MRPFMSNIVVFGIAGILLVGGCGDSSAPDTPSGGSSGAADEARKPMSQGEQLVGAWYRIGEGDEIVGLEFGQDAKVMLTSWTGRGLQNITLDYAPLEGGRLRLSMPQNPMFTQVLQCQIGQTSLALVPETDSMLDLKGGEFEKLSGKTIAERHREKLQEMAIRHEAATKFAGELLSQKGVLISADSVPRRIAFELEGKTGMWGGKAYVQTTEDNVLVRETYFSIDTPDTGKPTQLLVQLGATLGPPGARQFPVEKFTLTATPVDGGFRFADSGRELGIDASVHEELLGKYQAVVARQRELVDQMHARLGYVGFLDGAIGNTNNKVRMAFLRDGQQDVYGLADVRGNQPLTQTSFTRKLAVRIDNGKPILRDDNGRNLLRATSDTAPVAFEALIDGRPGELTLVESLTKEAFDARRTRLNDTLRGMATHPLNVSGWFNQSMTSKTAYVRPLRLSLSSPDGKALAGTFHADALGLELPLTGTVSESLLGLVLTVEVPKVRVGETFDEDGTFTLQLDLHGDRPVLTGSVQPADSANRAELTVPSVETTKAYRDQLDALLAAGGEFVWGRASSGGGSQDPRTLRITPGPGSQVTVDCTFRSLDPMKLTGEIKEENGLVVLDLATTADTPHPRLNGSIRLWVVPMSDGRALLSGYSAWKEYRDGEKQFASFVPVEK